MFFGYIFSLLYFSFCYIDCPKTRQLLLYSVQARYNVDGSGLITIFSWIHLTQLGCYSDEQTLISTNYLDLCVRVSMKPGMLEILYTFNISLMLPKSYTWLWGLRGRDARASPARGRPVCTTTGRWPMRRYLPVWTLPRCACPHALSWPWQVSCNTTHNSFLPPKPAFSLPLPPGLRRDNSDAFFYAHSNSLTARHFSIMDLQFIYADCVNYL